MNLFTDEQIAQIKSANANVTRISAQMKESLEQICKGMAPALQHFGAAMQAFDDAVKQNYEAAGAPYGDTQEGRWRWMNEQTTEAQARQRDREAAQRGQHLEDMRRRGAQVRAKMLSENN